MTNNWIVSYMKKKEVFVNTNDGLNGLLKISAEGVEPITNIWNKSGMMMAGKPVYEPIQYQPAADVEEGAQAFKDVLLQHMACDMAGREAIREWFFNLFLLNIRFPKRLLYVTGAICAGKTTAGRLFRALVMGRDGVGENDFSPLQVNQAMISEPLVVLDNYEEQKPSASLCKYLKLAEVGAMKVSTTRKKDENKDGTSMGNSLLLVVRAKNHTPLQVEIQRRFVEVEFSDKYFRADFDEGEAITNVILRRDLILSAMLKLTAERLGRVGDVL